MRSFLAYQKLNKFLGLFNMLYVGIFVFELVLLFWLSRRVQVRVSQLFHRVTGSLKVTVSFAAFLFLPGTLIHEIAHWLMAKVLFVHAGKISLSPKLENDRLRLGSVAIQKPDPIRRILIGTAPVFAGVGIIVGGLYAASVYGLFENVWMILLLGYVVFEIGNTMFSSKKDMEGAGWILLIAVMLAGIGYLLGLRIGTESLVSFFEQDVVVRIFQKGSVYLLFPIGVDVVVLGLLKIFRR